MFTPLYVSRLACKNDVVRQKTPICENDFSVSVCGVDGSGYLNSYRNALKVKRTSCVGDEAPLFRSRPNPNAIIKRLESESVDIYGLIEKWF